ncbi:MAG: zinc-dependent alcohol dehydrogenase family protein [Adhaeribacter sp.]
MKAMILPRLVSLHENKQPLSLAELPLPQPGSGEILLQVSVCGVCHTELDEIEGRTPPPRLPVILGHQVVGRVKQQGPGASRFKLGDRVGVAWILGACGTCAWCRSGRENLCPDFKATGRDAPGGYAEYMTLPENFAFPLPPGLSDAQAAPLLCAGAIGYRALRLTGLQDGQALGLTGFGASAHLVLQLARHLYPQSRVLVFARREEERIFALKRGAAWAGDTWEKPPVLLQAIIDTTPAWGPVTAALLYLQPGGRLVINAIRKEEKDKTTLQQLDYPSMLWMEKEVKSVANITRQDVSECLSLAARIPLRPQVQLYPLADANQALCDLKAGRIRGAKVLMVSS